MVKRLFGTNGIRFVVDENLDPHFVQECAISIGSFFGNRKVALGMDTRNSGEFVKSGLISGLTSTGCEVIDLGIVPTPCLQLASKNKAIPGVMITASHNPPEFNGIKCIDETGMELAQKNEREIEKIYWDRSFDMADWRSIKGTSSENYIETYIDSIMSNLDSGPIMKSKPKVALDCANGSACFTTPYILGRLNCEVVSLNSQPDGEPARPFEPTIENIEGLMLLTKSSGADIGIAHDGDADRTIFVDDKGNYVHGDRSFAVIAKDLLRRDKGLVVTPVSSSQCIEDVVLKGGGEIHYTKVGAPLVARAMLDKGAIFGGEENGGLIFPEHQYCRDGAMAAVKMIEIMVKRKKRFSALLREVPQYEQFKTKIQCPDGSKKKAIAKLAKTLDRKGKNINTLDGLKLFEKKGWVLIRPSGTEPIIRIFAEGKAKKDARELARKGKELIEDCL
jgi:phosphomannomutase/phosphoglucomutase